MHSVAHTCFNDVYALKCIYMHTHLCKYATICVSFWFSFIQYVLVYISAYVFIWLYLNVLVVYIVSLCIRYNSHYAVSSTHWVAPQDTLGSLVL